MQSANSLTGMQTMLFAPPYPAALSIPSAGWRSHLARDGQIPLAKPVIQIGRMEGNDIVLSDPLVSRHHAVVRWNAGGYELEDLAAPNGTYVDGQRVTGRVGLAPGNLVRLGGTEMVFQVMTADQQGQDVNATSPAEPTGRSGFVVRPALPGVDALGPAGRTLVAPPAPPPSAAPPPLGSRAAPFAPPGSPSMGAGPPPLAASAHPYYAMMAQPAQGGFA
ncbi:MAG TPA: FHA domain-containing protein, partial [Ktedonobacterales bacterium]|nr:FHA domain-containing protein [Ktedonobacterales bacterium]